MCEPDAPCGRRVKLTITIAQSDSIAYQRVAGWNRVKVTKTVPQAADPA